MCVCVCVSVCSIVLYTYNFLDGQLRKPAKLNYKLNRVHNLGVVCKVNYR